MPLKPESIIWLLLVIATSKPALRTAAASSSGALNVGYPLGVVPWNVVSILHSARSAADMYFVTYS